MEYDHHHSSEHQCSDQLDSPNSGQHGDQTNALRGGLS